MHIYSNKPKLKLVYSAILMASVLSGCGGGSGGSDNQPPSQQTDTSPNAFTFIAQSDVALNTLITSAAITISGINSPTQISISSGAEYSIDNGEFTSQSGTIENNQTVIVRLNSAAQGNTSSQATLTIGDKSATFSIMTLQPEFDGVTVDINLDTKHIVGGIDTLDRPKYINIHATELDNDWGQNDSFSLNAPNELGTDLALRFMQDYDVYFGRDTGSIGWNLRNVSEDTSRAGFVDEASATKRGGDVKWSYDNNTSIKYVNGRALKDRMNDMIIGGQQHPYWPEGTIINPVNGSPTWSFSQTDTNAEPLGTATGHYMAQFLAKFFKQNDSDMGQVKPKYFEVMNEPLYDLTTDREGQDDYVEPLTVFEFHNTVAAEIRKLPANDDIMIGGYTIAFPDFDKNNFQRWIDRDKLFIDTAGENMDFISIHLYDFPTFQNTERYRRGSNLEATLDMLEQYTFIKFGQIKPILISEVGSSVHAMVNQDWSPQRDAEKVRSITTMNTQFLERPNTILKVMPFVPVKAEWGRKTVDGKSIAYSSRLMIQKKERPGESGDEWVYSDHVKFYQLWSDVKGTRSDSWTSDLDIMADSYVDGNKAYIVLTSLEFSDTNIKLNALGVDNNNLTSVKIKELSYTNNNETQLIESTATSLPNTLTLPAEATTIIELTYANSIDMPETNNESKYYASTYQQAISANTNIVFDIKDVTVGTQGEAVLRLGIGRDHGKSLTPTVTLNGTTLNVPTDFRGYDQKQGKSKPGRENFFGVIEIPVPYSALQQNNHITINFTDNGGFVSSAALQVFNSSKPLERAM